MTAEISRPDVYTDFNRFAELRSLARNESASAVREVAGQFESLFLKMMIKSMREASFGGGLMENDQTQFYRDMHDNQLSLNLAKKSSLGLADLIVKQLGKSEETLPASAGKTLEWYRINRLNKTVEPVNQVEKTLPNPVQNVDVNTQELKVNKDKPITTSEDFVSRLTPYAKQAAAELGVDPKLLIAQAALETGWGKAVIRHSDGTNSHNLFGIKADKRWQGDRVSVPTMEFRQGVAEKSHASFRSYADFKQSFDDYVRFLKTNPRYEKALNNAGDPFEFINGLQQAGYATDPNYANKVMSIFQRNDLAKVL